MEAETDVVIEVKCFHCGEECEDIIAFDDKAFCCIGCKTVYDILRSNDLCAYYSLEANSGISQKNQTDTVYDYLDDDEIRKKILSFDSPSLAKISLLVPAIHCVSCIWLLENLRKLNDGILKAEVIFGKKTVTIDFNPTKVLPSELCSLLSSLGYPPVISLETAEEKSASSMQLLYRLAIAGFCFGNIMLFSFPEYLGIDRNDNSLMRFFSWLNLALSIPVISFCGWEYIVSAVRSFRQKRMNIDVPIAAGLIALFARSSFDIISATGPGYLDSFSGLVFFLLIGRWFQNKTYESLSFDRDFKSYFPLAVNRWTNGEWKPVIIYNLRQGDRIRIRNMEIVPADATLLDDQALFDYSFVTGEARPVKSTENDRIYAGGRLIGNPVEMIVERPTSQSHLTSLWNSDIFKKVDESRYKKIIDAAAQRFTWVVIALAAVTAIYWQWYKPQEMWLVLTSVLMVACPCALALAAPFTYGNMLRAFGENNFYLKNADVIERLAGIDAVVFDKTGTVTHGKGSAIEFDGFIAERERAAIKLITSASTHPLSTLITRSISEMPADRLSDFTEIPGKGIQATVDGIVFLIGSAEWVGLNKKTETRGTRVFVSIGNEVRGYFSISVGVRGHLKDMLVRLGKKCVALLSGDNNADYAQMSVLFANGAKLFFNQSPHDKLAYIKMLQQQGRKVLMIGDGLNDAGALKQSDVGIAVTDNTGVFTPACDGILTGEKLAQLDRFISLAKSSSVILKTAFAISFFYNAVTLTFAVTGHLTPLVAAILMPISSISVVGFSALAVKYVVYKKLRK